MTPTVTTTWDLLFASHLPVWLVLLITSGAMAAILHLLHRELRRRRARGAARWLYITRAALVLLLAIILAQPILALRHESRRPGDILVVADPSASMLRQDAWTGTELLDLAAAVDQPLAARETRPHAAADRLAQAQTHLTELATMLRDLHAQLAQGLPWGPSFDQQLAAARATMRDLLADLREHRQALAGLEAAMREAASRPDLDSPFPDFEQAPFDAVAAVVEATATLTESFAGTTAGQRTPRQMEQLLDQAQAIPPAAEHAITALRELQTRADQRFWEHLAEAEQQRLAVIGASTRLQLARQAFDRLAGTHPDLPLVSPDWQAIADSPSPGTDLYAPIDELLDGPLAERQISAILLVSDGGQNLPPRPDLLRRLRQRDVPLHTLGVGRDAPIDDVAIVDYRLPGIVRARQVVPLHLRLKTAVPAETPIEITVSAGGEELERRGVQATGEAQLTLDIELRAPAEDVGPWTIAATTPEPDAAPDNARVRVPLRVVRANARLLLIAPQPRWDLVYLMRALNQLPVRLDPVFWGALPDGEEVDRGGGSGRIPDQLSRFERYDLIIIDGPAFPGMTDEDRELFRAYVEGGGTLLLSHGGDSGGSLGLFAEAPAGEVQPGELAPALLPPLPPVSLSADPSLTIATWRQLAQPRLIGTAPEAHVPLLVADERLAFSLQFAGRGRVYHLAVGDLFRLREWDGGPAMNRFTSALAADLLSPVFADAEATAGLWPPLPLPGGDAWIIAPPAKPERLRLPRADQATLTIGGQERTIPLARLVSAESLVLRLQPEPLQAMAAAAGGTYRPLTAINAIPDRLEIKPDIQVTFRQIRLWNLPVLLILSVLIFTIDWVLRRHCGLIL